MGDVTLTGLARRKQQFQLPHNLYCEPTGYCHCQDVTVRTMEHNPRTGERLTRMVKNRVPGTITILWRRSVTVDDSVLLCPGVKAALHSKPKRLRLT